jgi:type IV secretory pathway TrbD component
MNETPQGFEVPLHRSLTEPILLAGLPRRVAFLVWTIVAAIVLGGHQFWVLAPGLVVHWACVHATRYDPELLEVFRAANREPTRMEPY